MLTILKMLKLLKYGKIAKSGEKDKMGKIRQNRQNWAKLGKIGVIRHNCCSAIIQRSKAECQQKLSKISRHTEARRREIKIFWSEWIKTTKKNKRQK